MSAPKGNRFSNGRPQGSKNQKSIEWENLGDFLTKEGAERCANIMQSCDEEQFMKYYGMLLEYFKPKHARSEVKQTGETKTIVEFVGGIPDTNRFKKPSSESAENS